MAATKQKRDVAPTTRIERQLRKVVARTGGVRGFPELTKSHARCTLCKLVPDNGDLLKEIHFMLREGTGTRRIATLIAPDLRERDLKPIDFRAISRHHNAHVQVALIVDPKKELPPPPPPPAVPAGPKVPLVEGPAAESYVTKRDPKTDDEADYFELRKLYDRLLPMLDLANRDLKSKAETNRGLTPQDYKTIVTMYSECRQQLEALNKMRNSNRLTRAVIEAHTSQVLTMLSEPLGQKLRDIRRQLEHGDQPGAVALLCSLIDSDLPPMLISTGKEAIRRSVDEYKLH